MALLKLSVVILGFCFVFICSPSNTNTWSYCPRLTDRCPHQTHHASWTFPETSIHYWVRGAHWSWKSWQHQITIKVSKCSFSISVLTSSVKVIAAHEPTSDWGPHVVCPRLEQAFQTFSLLLEVSPMTWLLIIKRVSCVVDDGAVVMAGNMQEFFLSDLTSSMGGCGFQVKCELHLLMCHWGLWQLWLVTVLLCGDLDRESCFFKKKKILPMIIFLIRKKKRNDKKQIWARMLLCVSISHWKWVNSLYYFKPKYWFIFSHSSIIILAFLKLSVE